jgi:hypothetical protein
MLDTDKLCCYKQVLTKIIRYSEQTLFSLQVIPEEGPIIDLEIALSTTAISRLICLMKLFFDDVDIETFNKAIQQTDEDIINDLRNTLKQLKSAEKQ